MKKRVNLNVFIHDSTVQIAALEVLWNSVSQRIRDCTYYMAFFLAHFSTSAAWLLILVINSNYNMNRKPKRRCHWQRTRSKMSLEACSERLIRNRYAVIQVIDASNTHVSHDRRIKLNFQLRHRRSRRSIHCPPCRN